MNDAERLIFYVAEKLGLSAGETAEKLTANELLKWASLNQIDENKTKQMNLKKLHDLVKMNQRR
tara:strand:+ start:395 stop:586 length:192 start_codon:yes stop_codon:yes gene_type:complete